eukprot:ANDGO_00212.mRNA.1 hypothetical protein
MFSISPRTSPSAIAHDRKLREQIGNGMDSSVEDDRAQRRIEHKKHILEERARRIHPESPEEKRRISEEVRRGIDESMSMRDLSRMQEARRIAIIDREALIAQAAEEAKINADIAKKKALSKEVLFANSAESEKKQLLQQFRKQQEDAIIRANNQTGNVFSKLGSHAY